MRRTVVLLLVTALFLAACGEDGGDSGGDDGGGEGGSGGEVVTEPVTFGDGDEVWLRVETSGGYVPEIVFLRATPSLVLRDDGTLVRRSPEESPFEDVVPHFESLPLDEDQAAELLAAFAAVVDGPDPGEPEVTDLASTTIEVTTDGDTREVSIYGLSEDSGLSDEEIEARAAAEEAIDAARGLERAEPFLPEEWLALTIHSGIEPGGITPWPLEGDRIAGGDTGNVCTRLVLDDYREVAAALDRATANEGTFLGPNGSVDIALVPVLTGEESCPDGFVER